MYLCVKNALLRLTPVVYYINILFIIKLVPVFLKYFEYMHFEHKLMDWDHKILGSPCIITWYNI